MSTAQPPALKPLIAGQRLDRGEFHERYMATPPGFRAELIGGVVVMPSPVGDRHATVPENAVGWTWTDRSRTPGIAGGVDASTALDELSEVQPDTSLRILPEKGGQTRNIGNIIGGCPELIVEVANTSRLTDLGSKPAEYQRAGALEHVVFAIHPDEVFWHVREGDRLVRISPDPDGLYRSRTFPGLWLNPAAVFEDDPPAIIAALEQRVATEQYDQFVARLAAIRP